MATALNTPGNVLLEPKWDCMETLSSKRIIFTRSSQLLTTWIAYDPPREGSVVFVSSMKWCRKDFVGKGCLCQLLFSVVCLFFYVEETSFWEQDLQTEMVNTRQHLNIEILSGVPKIFMDFVQIRSMVIVTLLFWSECVRLASWVILLCLSFKGVLSIN